MRSILYYHGIQWSTHCANYSYYDSFLVLIHLACCSSFVLFLLLILLSLVFIYSTAVIKNNDRLLLVFLPFFMHRMNWLGLVELLATLIWNRWKWLKVAGLGAFFNTSLELSRFFLGSMGSQWWSKCITFKPLESFWLLSLLAIRCFIGKPSKEAKSDPGLQNPSLRSGFNFF